MKNRGKGNQGFTLIELVMVIAIVGILSAIALPKFVALNTVAKEGATKGALGGIRSMFAIKYAESATAGAVAVYPSVNIDALNASTYFADGLVPKNQVSGKTGGVQALAAIPENGLAQDATYGFWYVTAAVNNGRAGAYSDGVIDTSGY